MAIVLVVGRCICIGTEENFSINPSLPSLSPLPNHFFLPILHVRGSFTSIKGAYICYARFCPSVFFYLLLVLPGLWMLEAAALSERTRFANCTNLTSAHVQKLLGSKTAHPVDVFGVSARLSRHVCNHVMLAAFPCNSALA